MDFPFQLKKLRASFNLKQTQFAEIIGKSQGDVSELENGKQQPTKTLMVYLEYRYGDMATWGTDYAKKKTKWNVFDIGENVAVYRQPSRDDLLEMARETLESGMSYAGSLAVNIQSLYEAVQTRRQLMDHEKRLTSLEGKKKDPKTDTKRKAM